MSGGARALQRADILLVKSNGRRGELRHTLTIRRATRNVNGESSISPTPFRFRTKRQLWHYRHYSGLAVVTHTSAEYEMRDGRVVRSRKPVSTRGLNYRSRLPSSSPESTSGRGQRTRDRPDRCRSL
jgi:hypothetical protein